ncbi:MAG: SOS response-associated peptidase [Bacilli bacterium]
MCGRFSFAESFDLLLETFDIPDTAWSTAPRYNIGPGQLLMAIVNEGGRRQMELWKWGLIPSWSKDAKLAYSTFNARAESVFDKPMFRVPVRRQRCLVPADGFYEWKKNGTEKQPMRIMLQDRRVFAFAGIYDIWLDAERRPIHTVSIVTTTPNELMADIHNRMPVILPTDAEALWLDPEIQEREVIQPLLVPYSAALMRAFPVSTVVNNVRNDVPECLQEV